MSCTHLSQIATLPSPKLSQSVHREECTQCFDGQDSDAGVDAADEEPPLKMTKLAIVEEREEDKYEFITAIRCYKCNPDGVTIPDSELTAQPAIATLVKNVLTTQSSARKSEVQAWEEEILPCEHTLTLQQVQMSKEGLEKVIGQGAHCTNCSLTSNLWLCLTCGNLGCGRAQFGGVEGNGHGLAHFEMTRDLGEVHPVSVKLGTITAEGNADIYCYVCNDSKLDPELAKHLATFGIRVESQQKTEKSMSELVTPCLFITFPLG
ncbi:hypothetical protein MPER_10652 [Moniliophthora perniciosa FA553]|nr:hypothetical protein MPER_10652 [Moniliophthora perniciosa FA553]